MSAITSILLWIVVAVAAFNAAYASANCSPLIAVYLFALLRLAQTDRWRKAFYSGLAVGLLIGVLRLDCFWRIFSCGAVALWFVYAFWTGLFVALARLCVGRLGPRWGWVLIPFVWIGLEYFRSELYYLRFSWLNVGYAFAGAPWQMALKLTGVYGAGFLLISIASVTAFWWQKSKLWSVGLLLLGTGGICLSGLLSGKAPPPHPVANIRVAGVQMEFPFEKEVLIRLNDLMRKHPDAELLVLSEYTFDGPVPLAVREWCRQKGRYLIVGGKDPAPGANFYDTAFVIGPGGDILFRQVKAVPIQFFKDGRPAPEQKLWNSPWGKIGICICYDLSYTRVADRLVTQGAEAIIVPTMDMMDWGRAEHELHTRVAPVRAIEYGLPIFRVASSGISQWTDCAGRVLATAPCPGDGATLAGTLEMRGPGRLPPDRWLAPFAVGVTTVLILGLSLRRLLGNRPPASEAPYPLKTLLRCLVRILYRFRAYNEAALDTPGPVLLLPNHVSWWDWLLIGVCLEKDWRFVTSSTTAETSWLHRWIMVNRRTFPVDMNSPYAVKRMAEYLRAGGRLVLFPEGRLSCTGSLMKLFDGTGFLIFKTRAKVITAYIRGAQRLPFSRNPGRKEWFPRVSVHFSDVLPPPGLEHVSTTAARARLADWLRDQMVRQRFETEMEFGPKTPPAAIAEAARRQPQRAILQDATMQKLTYRRLLVGAELLAAQWRRRLSATEERIGVLLPNVNALPVVLLSVWAAARVPAILNYSSGTAVLLACARLAGLKHIITSRSFIERARLDLGPLETEGMQLLFLEEVGGRITRGQKLTAAMRALFQPARTAARAGPEDTAVVLFTSGSESLPKGVELTHRNLLANIRQMLSVIDLMETDRFFSALPFFHSFGLTVSLLLPLVEGVFVFLYPTPLHYRAVPSAFYNLDCTVFFGTNTFLSAYARKAHPYDFRTLRYVFAGAERLQETTINLWARKFGVRILEGYGATECSPCLAANLPMRPREGSVGQFLPGIEYRLEPVEGLERSTVHSPRSTVHSPQSTVHSPQPTAEPAIGRLLVRGPNVMKGYLNPEANARFLALGGWYDTGDIVEVDAEGFVFILGRLRRFAKVTGEMVSLTAVEDALAGAFPQYGLKFAVAVVARPDEARGEKLIAVTNEPRLKMEQVRAAIQAGGLSNLAVPREIKVVRELPRLGGGKINHRELEKMI